MTARFSDRSSTVLVVDDEEIDREILVELLRSHSYRVLQAHSGREALRIVQDEPVDLVLLDLAMSEVSGLDVCRHIKDEMGLLDLPTVIITSSEDRASRLDARSAGCDDFLTKPIDPSELGARVGNLLRIKAYHDQRRRQKENLEAELERTREKLLQVDRLATLGTLVAGVGHELGNILSTLTMTIDLMRKRTDIGQLSREVDYARLEYAAQHIQTHVRYLLNYGRPEPLLRVRLDLREVIRSTLDMLRVSGRLRAVRVETDFPDEPVYAEVNRTQLEQVFINLVGNAVDAIEKIEASAPLITVALTESDEGHASFTISDNGCGITATQLHSIFDAFYTTKPVGKGTGLGLPVVKRIVESYGGQVLVSSEVDRGTTVQFDLMTAQPA